MAFVSPYTSFIISLFFVLLPISCLANNMEASPLLRRMSGSETALSPAVVEVIVIGLALSASSLLAFHLYKRYKPTNPVLPPYTAPAPRFYARKAIRIRGDYRGWGPAQGAFPMSSPSRVSASPGEGVGIVSIRSMPTAHFKTKVAFPAVGTPPDKART